MAQNIKPYQLVRSWSKINRQVQRNGNLSTQSTEKGQTLKETLKQPKDKLLDQRHKPVDTGIKLLVDLDKKTVQQIIIKLKQHDKQNVIRDLERYVNAGPLQRPRLPYDIKELISNEGNGIPRVDNEKLLQRGYRERLPPIADSSSPQEGLKAHTQDSILNIEHRINRLICNLKSNIEELSEIVIKMPKELEVEPTDLNHGMNSGMDETQECNTQNDKVLGLFKELMQKGEEYHKRIQTLAIKIKEDKWITTTRRQNEELAALRHEVSRLTGGTSSKKPTERPNIEPKPPSSPRSPRREAYQNRNRGYVPNSVRKVRGGYNKKGLIASI